MSHSIEKRLEDLKRQNRELREMVKESFQPMTPPQMPAAPQQGQAPAVDPATGQPIPTTGAPAQDPSMAGGAPPPAVDPATGQPIPTAGAPVDPAMAAPAPPIDPAQLEGLAQGLEEIAGAVEQMAAKINELESTLKIQARDMARSQKQIDEVEGEVYELSRSIAKTNAMSQPMM